MEDMELVLARLGEFVNSLIDLQTQIANRGENNLLEEDYVRLLKLKQDITYLTGYFGVKSGALLRKSSE